MGFLKPIYVYAKTLPEAWEISIYKLWKEGITIDTEYGENSRDCPAVIYVEDPFAEPRIHLKGLTGGFKSLREYLSEVIDGVNDHLVETGKVDYTYHERIFKYPGLRFNADMERINQIEYVVRKLSNAPYSRRAQAITWVPHLDTRSEYPPCLQRLWFRIVNGKLVLHIHIRSNDAFKAAFMNMYAFTELQRTVAKRLGVDTGYYLHVADSYHIYERDWKWAEKFIKQIENGVSKRYYMRSDRLGIG